MKTHRIVWLATVLLAPVVFVSCNGGNDSNDRIGADRSIVPDSASTSKGFFDYLFSLNMSDESSEPAAIKDGFAAPQDEANEPTPLG